MSELGSHEAADDSDNEGQQQMCVKSGQYLDSYQASPASEYENFQLRDLSGRE